MFNNKNILITGAGSGIGRELSIELNKLGANVIGADIDLNTLEETKNIINNDRFKYYEVDMENSDSINKFLTNNLDIDILINNAGIIHTFTKVEDLNYELINKVMNINFFGPLRLIKHFIPLMKKKDYAHIINISSMGGFFPFPGQVIYGSSKAALKILTEGLYAELKDTNIKTMVVMPGAVKTNITNNSNVPPIKGSKEYKMTSANAAAKDIIKGIEKNKLQLYVGGDSKFMNIFYKLNPRKAISFISDKVKL